MTTLVRNTAFRAYWFSTAMSGVASAMGGMVIPLIAVTIAEATPAEMALLSAAGMIPSLFLQLPAGMWADRPATRNRRALITADCASLVLSLVVPALWFLDRTTFLAILLAEFSLALVGVMRSSSAVPVLARIVPSAQFGDASGKINAVRSVTDIGGQGLVGLVIAFVAQPLVLLANAIAYGVSALVLLRVPKDAAYTVADESTDAASGRSAPSHAPTLPLVLAVLRRREIVTLCLVALANGIMDALFILYAVHTLEMGASVIAFCVATGAVGGVIGGLLVGPLERRIGARLSAVVATMLVVASIVGLVLARPGPGAIVAAIGFEFAGALGGVILLATTFGVLLSSASQGSESRTIAVMNNCLQVAALSGIALGGYLGTSFSLRTGVVAAVVSAVCAVASAVLLFGHRTVYRSGGRNR